jgi:hypothetical protein
MATYNADEGLPGVSDLSGPLCAALIACAASGLSGTLRVNGDPGGVIYMDNGGLTGILTPGAPSAEVVLLRSGRVPEATWDAAFAASAANGGSMAAELAAGAGVGAGELEAVLWTTLADAMFVLASGHVEECEAYPGQVDYLLPLQPAADLDQLLGEAARRVRLLATLHGFAARERSRFVAVPAARQLAASSFRGSDEILALADGRRTARDIAFASGSGVYATLLQLTRLREAGVLAAVPSGSASATQETTSPSGEPDQADSPAKLPRRIAGLPALPRRAVSSITGRAAVQGLLGPRSGGNASPTSTE